MRDAIVKFVNQYAIEKNKVFANNEFGNFVRREIPNEFYNTGIINTKEYYVVGSVGQGNWATIPWICIFDRTITTSATKGIYIVYLLSKDCSKLYLTFNQGCTDIKKDHSMKETIKILHDNARKIIEKIDDHGFKHDHGINLGNGIGSLGTLYQNGTIFYKEYQKDNIPDEEELQLDLDKMMSIYRQYRSIFVNSNEWWPSLEEYHPGIKKEKWIELLNDPSVIGPVWGGVLAMFYEQGGAATCSQLGEIYDRDASGISGNCTQLAMFIHKKTMCPLIEDEEKKRYWPVLFVGRKASSEEKGSWVWKLRDELYDAISESDIMKYLPMKSNKSWLLTWNPANYEYSEYDNKRQDVLNGEKYIDQWACANTHVQIGDRVYLMRIGSGDKNGIVASGHAVNTSYLAPHYDPNKAAAGEQIRKIDVEFDCLLDKNSSYFLQQNELSELFPNQQWSPQGSGIEIKKEYRESLEQEWQKYMDKDQGEEEEVMDITVKEAISQIKDYIASKGFTYSNGLIENFYLSLKSKPFVILAGTSGTGKTRLVRLFAEAIDAQYKMVPVRPDWSDSSDLFGHVDLNGNFIPGVILEYISDAYKHPNKPYILCLDEMNLARVEYYLSDFLSVIETRDFDGERIISDPLVSSEKYGSDVEARNKYGEIGFPQNLYLVGTVNMDETTFPFSKKVLDRANTIEFNYVDLDTEKSEYVDVEKLHVPNSFLKTKYLLLAQCREESDYIKPINEKLQKLNQILQKANAHVGYRVRDEIVFYMLNNKDAELISEDDAFDNEIMQKILPRIQGSSSAVKSMLCELFKEFAGDYEGFQIDSNDTASMMLGKIRKEGARYPKSAEKTAFMVRRFEEDGFTSYWL